MNSVFYRRECQSCKSKYHQLSARQDFTFFFTIFLLPSGSKTWFDLEACALQSHQFQHFLWELNYTDVRWRMLETKCDCGNFEMLMTDLRCCRPIFLYIEKGTEKCYEKWYEHNSVTNSVTNIITLLSS